MPIRFHTILISDVHLGSPDHIDAGSIKLCRYLKKDKYEVVKEINFKEAGFPLRLAA